MEARPLLAGLHAQLATQRLQRLLHDEGAAGHLALNRPGSGCHFIIPRLPVLQREKRHLLVGDLDSNWARHVVLNDVLVR